MSAKSVRMDFASVDDRFVNNSTKIIVFGWRCVVVVDHRGSLPCRDHRVVKIVSGRQTWESAIQQMSKAQAASGGESVVDDSAMMSPID